MVKAFSIGLLGDHYVGWTGGAAIFASLVSSLLSAAPQQGARISVLLNARMLSAQTQAQFANLATSPTSGLLTDGPVGAFLQAVPTLSEVIFYKDLAKATEELGLDILGPTGLDLGSAFPKPWFSYIPDFQHKYLPGYFSKQEIAARDKHFGTLLENSSGVFVNSATVAADIKRFYPATATVKRILRFPQFFPAVESVLSSPAPETAMQLGIRGPYILSCSQRWAHKRHHLIISGFAEYLKRESSSPLQLVFTGELSDYRNSEYVAGVASLIENLGIGQHVHQLGLIPRLDQLRLIAGAQAVISASQFEGGPGASGTAEAAMLGTPIIASNIEANQELTFGKSIFFDPSDCQSLLNCIHQVAKPGNGEARQPPFDAQQIHTLTVASGIQTLAALRAGVY